jgi:hypothetical protein
MPIANNNTAPANANAHFFCEMPNRISATLTEKQAFKELVCFG